MDVAATDIHSNTTAVIERTNNTTLPNLYDLNKEKTWLFVPVIVYVAILMVVGIVGNGLVCYVYRWRFRRTTSNFFIVFLAIVDLMGCCVGMSFEISDLALPYLFNAAPACKIFRFFETWIIGASGLTLVCVAFDRYYKLCKPLNRFSLKKAKVFSFVAVTIALVIAVPALIFFGRKTVATHVSGINGTECSTDDSMIHSPVVVVYYASLMITFVFSFVCLLTLYILIGVFLWRRKNMTIGEQLKTKKAEYPRTHRFVHSESSSSLKNSVSSSSEEAKKGHTNTQTNIRKVDSMTKGQKYTQGMGTLSLKTTRLTSIFFSVSVAFVVSFLPFLIVNILKTTEIAFDPFTSDGMEILYNFCVRSYFINNAINPIIYSVLNINFRKECKYVLKKVWRACCRQ